MGEIGDRFNGAFRDYAVPGVPASGAHDPEKSEIRGIASVIETAIASVAASILRYANVAAMNGVAGTAAGQLAYVFSNNGSTSDGANGYYQWSGSAWVAAPWLFSGANAAAIAALSPVKENATGALLASAASTGATAAITIADNPNDLRANVPDAASGTTFEMFITQRNTGATFLTAGGIRRQVTDGAAQPIGAGYLTPGMIAVLSYSAGGGVFAILSIRKPAFGSSSFPVTAVAGANANVWTMNPQGSRLIDQAMYRLQAPTTPTGPVTVEVIGGPSVALRYDNDAPVDQVAGITAGWNVVLRWDATNNANVFRLVSNAHDISRLNDLAAVRDIGSRLTDVRDQPWGTIGANNAVTTTQAIITVCGSSVFTDSAAREGGAPIGYAPGDVLVARSNEAWPLDGVQFVVDTRARGGQVMSQFLAQLGESPAWIAGSSRFVLVGAGMNDFQVSHYNAGQGMNSVRAIAISIIEANRAKGIKTLLCTSPHPRTTSYDYAAFFGANTGIAQAYPRIVAAPVNPETGQYPPASQSKGQRDMTGSGIQSEYDLRFWHGNRTLREVARAYPNDVILLDAEWAWFRYGVEVSGVNSLYDTGQTVHPNVLGHQVSFGRVLKQFATDLTAGRLLKRIYLGDV